MNTYTGDLTDLLEIAEDLELKMHIVHKLVADPLIDNGELYDILDCSLDAEEFKLRLVNHLLLSTANTTIVDKIFDFLSQTGYNLADIVNYISLCESEIQLYVTLMVAISTQSIVPVPDLSTAELIYYGLMDYDEYVNSLPYIYGVQQHA